MRSSMVDIWRVAVVASVMPALRRILIIDDSITSVMALREVLGTLYEVRAVLNFASIAGEIVRFPPDVVVLDLSMPALSGEQIAPRIRDLGCKAPILLYTGADALAAVRAKDKIGAVGIVTKGSGPSQVRSAVATAMLAATRLQERERPRRRISQPRLTVDF